MNFRAVTILVLVCVRLSEHRHCPLNLGHMVSEEDEDSCHSIKICVKHDIELNTSVQFSNKEELIIVGENNNVLCYNLSGIEILNVSRVIIKFLSFSGCGAVQTHDSIKYYVALTLVDSSSIHVTGTTFTNSVGTALLIINPMEFVNVSDSTFQSSGIPNDLKDTALGGGGMYIERLCKQQLDHYFDSKLHIIIEDCNFSDNIASHYGDTLGCSKELYSGLGYGGGLSLRFQHCYEDTTIEVLSNIFIRNSAVYGGAVEMILCSTQNHYINFRNIESVDNEATEGGGGIEIFLEGGNTINNTIIMEDTKFTKNWAKYGGGVAVSAKYTSDNFLNNYVNFSECNWTRNMAHFGSALHFFPTRESDGWGNLPHVKIENCTFSNNCNCDLRLSANTTLNKEGYGAILVTNFRVIFSKTNSFSYNSGSCIHATSSILEFKENSVTKFENNKAEYGAGIALLGVSVMVLYSQCELIFVNNIVQASGAGILYHGISKLKSNYYKYRFLQPVNSSIHFTFTFRENCAPSDLRYLDGSFRDSSIESHRQTKYIKWDNMTINVSGTCKINNYHFIQNELCNYTENVNNSDVIYNYIEERMYFIPGIEKQLHITKPPILFQVWLYNSGNTSISFLRNNEYVLDSLTFYGQKGATAKVLLKTLSFDGLSATFEVELTNCPPFYRVDTIDNITKCRCNHYQDFYYGIPFLCKSENNSYSKISNGFWIDYDHTQLGGGYLTGYCPDGYCNAAGIDEQFMISLPFHLNGESTKLDQIICKNRIGILCGECVPGKAVHYHSPTFECKDTKTCSLGPLIFLVAEILPVSIAFIMLVFLGINLTSGGATGFIFFAQIYVYLEHRSAEFIKNDVTPNATISHHVFYQLFNFDFLEINSTTFCLWKEATVLDLLVIKYVVSAYALFLILGVVGLVKVCGRFKCLKVKLGQRSLVNVLSSFLIIVYSKCTYTSFNILWYEDLYNEKTYKCTVVALQGNWKYFGTKHIPYALTAILTVIFLTILFPLVLTFYPLSNKIVSILNLEENLMVLFASKVFPLYKFLPFFDSFQGSFKEKYRFFAGLYFVYRIAILSSLFAVRMNVIYLVVLIFIIIILTIHVICWPYKNKAHNIADALLFANLGLISSLKLMLVMVVSFSPAKVIKFIHGVEIIFVNIPIAVGIFLIVRKVVLKCRKWKKVCVSVKENHRDSFLLDDIRNESCSDHYHVM